MNTYHVELNVRDNTKPKGNFHTRDFYNIKAKNSTNALIKGLELIKRHLKDTEEVCACWPYIEVEK